MTTFPEWGGDSDFDDFSYIRARISAKIGNSLEMVQALNEITGTTVKQNSSFAERAGLAFFNLAKKLDTQNPKTNRIAAKESLRYAIEYYRLTKRSFVFEGLTQGDVTDYIYNPGSKISLTDLSVKLS